MVECFQVAKYPSERCRLNTTRSLPKMTNELSHCSIPNSNLNEYLMYLPSICFILITNLTQPAKYGFGLLYYYYYYNYHYWCYYNYVCAFVCAYGACSLISLISKWISFPVATLCFFPSLFHYLSSSHKAFHRAYNIIHAQIRQEFLSTSKSRCSFLVIWGPYPHSKVCECARSRLRILSPTHCFLSLCFKQ